SRGRSRSILTHASRPRRRCAPHWNAFADFARSAGREGSGFALGRTLRAACSLRRRCLARAACTDCSRGEVVMDALDLLEGQHEHTARLIVRIGSEPSPGAKTRLVAELARTLGIQLRLEQLHLYVPCAARTADPEIVRDAYEDHAAAQYAMDTLVRT